MGPEAAGLCGLVQLRKDASGESAAGLLVEQTRLLARNTNQGEGEYPGMIHVWMFLSFPEAKLAQKEIFDLIMGRKNVMS